MSTEKKRIIYGSRRFKEAESPQITEKLDFGELVRRQIDRCLMNSQDEVAYAQHVKSLEALIPTVSLSEEYIEAIEECLIEYELYTPATCCGVAVDEDVIPGSKETVMETDWHGRFNAAINLFTSMGLTWKDLPGTGF